MNVSTENIFDFYDKYSFVPPPPSFTLALNELELP